MPKLTPTKPLPTVQKRSLTIDGPYRKKPTMVVWPVALVVLLVSVLMAWHGFASYFAR